MNNKKKESMFNKFHNFPFDEDMLSEWIKMLGSLRITSKFLPVLQMPMQLIEDKFFQIVLNLENKILLQTLEDETDDNTTLKRSVEQSLHSIAEYILFSLEKE